MTDEQMQSGMLAGAVHPRTPIQRAEWTLDHSTARRMAEASKEDRAARPPAPQPPRPMALTRCTVCDRGADRFHGATPFCRLHYIERSRINNAGIAAPVATMRERLARRRADAVRAGAVGE